MQILISGESGSGKSTAIRHLEPKETFIINVIDKPLPFKNFKKDYTAFSSDKTEGNYYVSDNSKTILNVIKYVSNSKPDIKNIIVDDFQYVMANEFMRRALEKGYEKFSQIGQNAWEIINESSRCRQDLNIFFMCHNDIEEDGKSRCKTIGKMLKDKITIEGMFTVVLHSVVQDSQYKFLTQYDGIHIAKSPIGLFEEKYIDNDLNLVVNKINDYFQDIPQ